MPSRYRHYKGKEYTVFGVARHSETLEELVVYRQEYGEYGLWVRPRQMFSEMVKVEGGMVEMKPGDFVNIPAFTKHRVDWTTPDEPTVWLGVRYGGAT